MPPLVAQPDASAADLALPHVAAVQRSCVVLLLAVAFVVLCVGYVFVVNVFVVVICVACGALLC